MNEQRFPTPEPVRLEIKVPSADVEISTVDGEESTITLDGPEKMIEATKVELQGDRLVVAMHRKPFGGLLGRLDGSLEIHARVPHHTHVEIMTASGDASLSGTFGAFDMKSASGGVDVAGELEGDAKVQTVSGDVRLRQVAGDLTVNSVSGDVEARAVGGSMSVKSVSGAVRVGSLRRGKASVQSVSGDIELGIAQGSDVDVDAGSASGELSSEVPLGSTPTDGNAPTVIVRANTVSGDVRVFRAVPA